MVCGQVAEEKTLAKLPSLPISHLSLYNLTIEPNTAFFKRTLNLPSAETNLKMLESATSKLEEIGLKRYEISAFAKPGYHSCHNTGYWQARPFFGLGPSAFSYYNDARFRNVANLNRYIQALDKDEKLNSGLGGWPGWLQSGRLSAFGQFAFQVDSLDVDNWD